MEANNMDPQDAVQGARQDMVSQPAQEATERTDSYAQAPTETRTPKHARKQLKRERLKNHPQLHSDLTKVMDEIRKDLLARKLIVPWQKDFTPEDVFHTNTAQAVEQLEKVVDIMSYEDEGLKSRINNTVRSVLKATPDSEKTDEKIQAFVEQIKNVAELVLNHENGIISNTVVYKYAGDGKQEGGGEGAGAFTNAFFRGSTTFKYFILEDASTAYPRADGLMTWTLIHETIHRVTDFGGRHSWNPAERDVYTDNKEKFRNLSLWEHMRNPDSYVKIFGLISKLEKDLKTNKPEETKTPENEKAPEETPEISMGEPKVETEYIVQDKPGNEDTLWNIAFQFYGDGRLWETLWERNKDTLRSGDPNLIYPGEKIMIPEKPDKKPVEPAESQESPAPAQE